MELDRLDCASLLTYSPRDGGPDAAQSRDIKTALKNGTLTGTPPSSISHQVARILAGSMARLPFAPFFTPPPVLVPTPKSSLQREGDLWVPQQLSEELSAVGLGSRVAIILKRIEAIPKAATSPASQRPTAQRHFETMAAQTDLASPGSFLLVDDVVTRGATLLGAANRLRASYPGVPIKAFAAIRTVSNPLEFHAINSPAVEVIRLRADGSTLRRPG